MNKNQAFKLAVPLVATFALASCGSNTTEETTPTTEFDYAEYVMDEVVRITNGNVTVDNIRALCQEIDSVIDRTPPPLPPDTPQEVLLAVIQEQLFKDEWNLHQLLDERYSEWQIDPRDIGSADFPRWLHGSCYDIGLSSS